MKEEIKSPFQILDWRIGSFSYHNQRLTIGEETRLHWKLNAHIKKLTNNEDEEMKAVLIVEFSAKTNDESDVKMSGVCLSLCTYDASQNERSEETFDRLVKATAMMNCLGNLRVFLLNQSILLSAPKEKFALPFINLNHFSFEEENEFET